MYFSNQTVIPLHVQPFEQDNVISDLIHEPVGNTNALNEQVESLKRQLNDEKYRTTQLILLNELSQQLETDLDPPVSAQLAVNTLERAIECSLVALFTHEPDSREYVVLASAGKMTSLIPPGYRQDSSVGLLGRLTKLKKTGIVNDTRLDSDFFRLENDDTLSIISVPMLQHGHVKGVLEICSDETNAFSSMDASIVEDVASELLRAWERSYYRVNSVRHFPKHADDGSTSVCAGSGHHCTQHPGSTVCVRHTVGPAGQFLTYSFGRDRSTIISVTQ
jgi:putative methionine-R-sulfoxide reductase with GAF domain